MRIGFDVAKVFGPRDGIASYTTSLLRVLADRAEKGDGYSLHLYAPDVDVEPADWERTLGRLPDSAVRHPGRHPEQDDLDLFHTTSFTDTGFFDGPVLFTVHDLTFLTHPEYHRPVNRAHCLRSTLRAVSQDAMLAVDSQATADEVRRWFHVPAERMQVVYPAPSPTFVALEGEDSGGREATTRGSFRTRRSVRPVGRRARAAQERRPPDRGVRGARTGPAGQHAAGAGGGTAAGSSRAS